MMCEDQNENGVWRVREAVVMRFKWRLKAFSDDVYLGRCGECWCVFQQHRQALHSARIYIYIGYWGLGIGPSPGRAWKDDWEWMKRNVTASRQSNRMWLPSNIMVCVTCDSVYATLLCRLTNPNHAAVHHTQRERLNEHFIHGLWTPLRFSWSIASCR